MKKRTIGIIGLGHVGAHVAFLLGMKGIADEVKLCDCNEQKLLSEHNDLMDAVMFMPHRVTYTMSDYAGLHDCDIIVIATGNVALLEAAGTRDVEMHFNVPEVSDFIPKVMAGGFDGIFVNISNPCDVITDLVARISSLPHHRVLGTGTGLDSVRLVNALVQQTGLSHNSFTAYMFGEHGNAQMVPWSLVNFRGKSLDSWQNDSRFAFDRREMQQKAIQGGWVTYKGKLCTEYGICATAAELISAIVHDEKRILAVSAALNGEYGVSGIYCGVPAVIGMHGVEQVMEYPLPEHELQEFRQCCQTIRGNIAKAATLLKR